jgi:hypothetical protein
MATAVWLRLIDLGPLQAAGIPEYPGGESSAHINGESGLIVARLSTSDGRTAGRQELWCIPPGGRAVCVAVDRFEATASGPPAAPMCDRMERVMNVRAPL